MKERMMLLLAMLMLAWQSFSTPTNQTVGGVNYQFDAANNVYVASGFDKASGLTSLSIAAKLYADGVGYLVTSVSDDAFRGETTLVSVTLPLTLKTIGAHAFDGCTALTTIKVPANVTTIGAASFKGCSALTSVVFDGRPTQILGTGDETAFAGVGSMLSPAVLQVPAAVYAARLYKNGLNWGGYFLVAPIIPAATQTVGGVIYTYKDAIRNAAFGVDLEQPCYVVTGFDASAPDATQDVVVPKVISGLPVLAIYKLSDPMIRSIELDTLFSYKVGGQDYPLIMDIEAIADIADLPEKLAFAGLGTPLKPVDVFVPTLDESYNIMLSIAYQVGTPKGGYLDVYGREHKEGGVSYLYNRADRSFAVQGFDAETATKTVEGGSYTYQVEIKSRLKDFFAVKEMKPYAFNNGAAGTPNRQTETAYINKLTLPTTLETIGEYALNNLTRLTSLEVPASVVTIKDNAFASMGSASQGSQVITLIGSPTFVGSAFAGIGIAANHAKLLCPKEDVSKYEMAKSTTLYGGYIDVVANTRKLTLTTPNADIVSVAGAGDYSYLTNVEVTATLKDAGYQFDGWSDGVKTLSRTIMLDKDTTVGVTYSVRRFDVTTSVNNAAWGDVVGAGTYEYKEHITLVATPQEGYHFVNWNDNAALSTATIEFDVPFEGAAYKATFAPNEYTISAVSNYPLACTVTGGGTYPYKQSVTLTTIGATGYEFVEWSDGVKTTTRDVIVPIGGLALVANYRLLGQYSVSALCDETMGTTSGVLSGYEHAVVHVTAAANPGYQFVRWSDGVTTAERDVTIETSNITLTAVFEPIDYEIVANVNDAKMGSVTGDLLYQAYNSTITLVATPKTGYHFVEWEDGSTDATRKIVVPIGGGTYTATFAIDVYELIARAEDEAMGMVTGSGNYEYMRSATITATANEGYTFLQWADGFKSTSRTVTLLVDKQEYVAQFKPNDYEIKTAVNNKAMGQVTGASIYKYNTEVTLTATSNSGFHFERWNDGVTDSVRVFPCPLGGGTYTAYFALNQYEIRGEVTPANAGTIDGVGTYAMNTMVTLTAKANDGYLFSKWQDNNSTNASRRVQTPRGGYTYTAIFTPMQYQIKTASNNTSWGTTTGDGTFEYQSKVTIEATPKAGYQFIMWEDGSISQRRQVTVPLNGATYSAIFAAITYTIEVQSADLTQGSVKGSGSFETGTEVELEAVPNAGYEFLRWSDENTSAKRKIVVSGDAQYIAYFKVKQYAITLTQNMQEAGSVAGAGTYDYLSEVTLTATANAGYKFDGWYQGETLMSTDASYKVVVPIDGATYKAQFSVLQYELNLETENADMGQVNGAGTYDYLSKVEIEAIPKEGYHFVEWQDGDKNQKRTVEVPLNGATYTAKFAINTYTVTVNTDDADMGTVTGSGEYDYNTEVTIIAEAKEGYHFAGWQDGDQNATRQVKVTADATYTAMFEANEYKVTVVIEGEGQVIGDGTYKYGETITLSATPQDGYQFDGWYQSETLLSTDAQLQLVISQDTTVKAIFSEILYTLTLTVNDEAMGTVEGAGTYKQGEEVTIKALPAEGYRFEGWSDGVKEAERKVVMTEDLTLEATFVPADTEVEDLEGVSHIIVINKNIKVTTTVASDIYVYSAIGQLVGYTHNQNALDVVVPETGLYLVKVADKTHRVMVR